jgi:hypothetical protein
MHLYLTSTLIILLTYASTVTSSTCDKALTEATGQGFAAIYNAQGNWKFDEMVVGNGTSETEATETILACTDLCWKSDG